MTVGDLTDDALLCASNDGVTHYALIGRRGQRHVAWCALRIYRDNQQSANANTGYTHRQIQLDLSLKKAFAC